MVDLDRVFAKGWSESARREVDAGLAGAPDESSRESFLRKAVGLALHLGHHEQAERWIDAAREPRSRGADAESTRRERRDALRLAVLLATQRYHEATTLEASLDWSSIDDQAWVSNLRLMFLLTRTDVAEPERLLPVGRATLRDPYDLGNRLRLLGGHHVQRGRGRRAARLFRAALRHLRRDPSLSARLLEIEVTGQLARISASEGRLRAAREGLARVVDDARRHHHPGYEVSFAVDLAWADAELGRFAAAGRLLDGLPLARPRTHAHVFRIVRALQARAEIAVEERRSDVADRCLRRARRLLGRFPHPRYQTYVRLTAAKTAALRARDRFSTRIDRRFREVEEAFRGLGSRGRHGLAATLVARAEHLLSRGRGEDAERCLVEGYEIARESEYRPIQARAVLVRSGLLLRTDVRSAGRHYEEILGRLGVVHDPERLFRIVANLYVHSWDLGTRIDLSDLHLRQICALKERLGDERFQALYREHVVDPVLRRFLERGDG